MMRRILILVVFTVIGMGCQQDEPMRRRIVELETKVASLEEQAAAKDELENLTTRITDVETTLFSNILPRGATFTAAQKGYSPIYTNSGPLFVAMDTITQYADGYRVRFRLGNPQSVDFQGTEVEVRWGPRRPPDGFKTVKYADWLKQFQTKKENIITRLRGGSWNPVDIVLASAHHV